MKHYCYDNTFKMIDTEGNKYTLITEQDDSEACDPREWDNLGTMVCWHREYRLGDKHNYEYAEDFLLDLYEKATGKEYNNGITDDIDETDIYFDLRKLDNIVIRGLEIYDHSGVTMSITDNLTKYDRWDSSLVGFIYVTKEKMLKETDATEENWKEKANKYLESEVHTYDQYLTGDVWWFKLTKTVIEQEKCPHCGEVIREYETEEEVDCCGGFFGDVIEENGIFSHLPKDIEFVEE